MHLDGVSDHLDIVPVFTDASVSNTNSRPKFGYTNTSKVVSLTFSSSNALWQSGDHTKGVSLWVSWCKGWAILAKFGMNFL